MTSSHNLIVFLIVSLASSAFAETTTENATFTDTSALCSEYVECLAAVRLRAAACPFGKATAAAAAAGLPASLLSTFADADSNDTAVESGCTTANELHLEFQQLIDKKALAHEKCIASKAPTAGALTKKASKKGKCSELSSRLASGERLFGGASRIRKLDLAHDNDKREKKQCARDLRQLRGECRAIQKCCPVVNECSTRQNAVENGELKKKRKQMKEAVRQCKRATHGGAKGDRKHKEASKKQRKESKREKRKEAVDADESAAKH